MNKKKLQWSNIIAFLFTIILTVVVCYFILSYKTASNNFTGKVWVLDEAATLANNQFLTKYQYSFLRNTFNDDYGKFIIFYKNGSMSEIDKRGMRDKRREILYSSAEELMLLIPGTKVKSLFYIDGEYMVYVELVPKKYFYKIYYKVYKEDVKNFLEKLKKTEGIIIN